MVSESRLMLGRKLLRSPLCGSCASPLENNHENREQQAAPGFRGQVVKLIDALNGNTDKHIRLVKVRRRGLHGSTLKTVKPRTPPVVLLPGRTGAPRPTVTNTVQGYLAHKKHPPSLGPP